jgi:catechol 2,3-dioxygenase-like lactoylglutathione lyase family enzyme
VSEAIHHCAFRCRDSEETRAFYEDFLGCPLVVALPVQRSQTGRAIHVLHTYFQAGNGGYIAFFEDRERSFDFKEQHDFDLHLSLVVQEHELQPMMERARERGIECRGIADHGFIRSIYLRDPNGYVVELVAKTDRHDIVLNPRRNGAHAVLKEWQQEKLALAD